MQISFDRLFAKNLQFFCETCAIRFLMSKSFQKAKFYQNLTSGSGSKQRFSLLQEKAVIQAVCLRTEAVGIKSPVLGLKGGLNVYVGKVRKFY